MSCALCLGEADLTSKECSCRVAPDPKDVVIQELRALLEEAEKELVAGRDSLKKAAAIIDDLLALHEAEEAPSATVIKLRTCVKRRAPWPA